MQLFKLIFEHDQLLEQLASNADPLNLSKAPMSLDDFMKPIPTFSRFYLSGTVLGATQDEHQFGLSTLQAKHELLQALCSALQPTQAVQASGAIQSEELCRVLDEAPVYSCVVLSRDANPIQVQFTDLELHANQGVRELKGLKPALEKGYQVVFKEPAHHGYDLHLFSKQNIYPALFHAFHPLLTHGFRFFSINGKKMGSERTFYFETYRLASPPHGFEEVFPESVLLG